MIVAIQMSSCSNIKSNFFVIEKHVVLAKNQGAKLVLLP